MSETMRGTTQRMAASAALARVLREQPLELDELSRARMERALLQQWRLQPQPERRARRASGSVRIGRGFWVASLAVSALIGAALAFFGRPRETVHDAALAAGRFELRVEDAIVQSGSVGEGQLLESGRYGRIALELASARLDMRPATQLRLLRLSESELAFSLVSGALDIDFHPLRHGEQRLRVETRSARVLVVGTRLHVEVDTLGNTQVGVLDGAVDVVPSAGVETRHVLAGGQTLVRVDEGDGTERAVRAAIEDKLAREPTAASRGAEHESGDNPTRAPAAAPAAAEHEPGDPLNDELELEPRVAPAHEAARKLQAARHMLRQAQHRAARSLLRGLAEQAIPLRFRVEALMLMAESYTAQGEIERGAAAYRRADEIAPKHAAGHNARFALARLLERYAHDREAAALAYRHYLELAPDGALVAQARQALCRLGSLTDCE